MAIHLTFRLKNGKKHGPYGMSGKSYLGPVTVIDDLVYSKIDGSCLGSLVRRSEIPKETESPFTDIETAIRRLFYLPRFTHQNIADIKSELGPQFSSKSVDVAISDLVSKGILECVCPGNYRMVI